MRLYSEELKEYKVLSLVGMAKNAGKTTALNFLIEEADDEGVVPGITSTGRDGEGTDLVTGTEKPKVFVYEDTIVTIPTELYEMADAGLEILEMTDYHSTFGNVLLCKVLDPGYVQVAGPTSTADQKKMSRQILDLGADFVLIDGAIDRRAIAAPDASDGIILSTGAVLSRDMKIVVDETMHVVEIYNLPVFGNTDNEKELATKLSDPKNSKDMMVISNNGHEMERFTSSLLANSNLGAMIDDDVTQVYIPGALTKNSIEFLSSDKLTNVTFIVKDPTKVFLDRLTWKKLRKKGFKLKVMQGIKIAAITVNPYAPEGYSFGERALLEAMKKAAGSLPVLDVKKPE